MPRDLRIGKRTAQQNAQAATIRPDDILSAQQRARECTMQYQRFLNAVLDESDPANPTGPDT